ncbi:MAG TPA: MASE1 domain-containing protein [Steroidobacteraceae bacterium]|nr:MASE1 domain-containing protein [Steroidobacteraceae bacterium]
MRCDREPTPIQDTLAADRRVRIVILAVGYTLTGIVGLSLAVPPGYATAVWPPSGIALAAVLMWGPRVWPGIAAGSVLVNLAVAMTTADTGFTWISVLMACAIAVGSTVQALVCAAAIQRWIGVSQMFESGPATLMFAGFAAGACLIAASWGVAALNVAGILGPEQFLASWQTWWLGDLIGMLVFAPVFLTWRQSLLAGRKPWRLGELAAAFALLSISTAAVFLTPSPAAGVASPMTFLPLPCLVWIAFRFRPNGVALGVCVMSLIAVAATANGTGPFGGERSIESLLALQAFIGLTAVMALTLASAVTGRRQSESALKHYSVEMEQLALTDELTGMRNRRGFLVLADQTLRMARRTRAKCALVFIDLDGLKRINDTRGHAAGDALIADAARVLGRVFRESDVVGRVGGDEFAVLALLDEHDGSHAVSSRLQAEIDRFNAQVVPTMRVSMSVGIEEIQAASDTPLDVLLSRADRAMYEKKRRRA